MKWHITINGEDVAPYMTPLVLQPGVHEGHPQYAKAVEIAAFCAQALDMTVVKGLTQRYGTPYDRVYVQPRFYYRALAARCSAKHRRHRAKGQRRYA